MRPHSKEYDKKYNVVLDIEKLKTYCQWSNQGGNTNSEEAKSKADSDLFGENLQQN